MTGGEVRGQVIKPEQRSPELRSARSDTTDSSRPICRSASPAPSINTTESSSNTLYSGNRAGSRYYYVVENPNATEAAQAWSGDVRPGFGNKVTAWVINPFIKYRGLELFGNFEQAKGRSATETTKRTWNHYAGEGVYRFLENQLYVAGRYNVAKGPLAGIAPEVTVDRVQAGGGWFLSHNLLAKAEYVRQNYEDFPATDIRNGGKFDGAVVEAVVSFEANLNRILVHQPRDAEETHDLLAGHGREVVVCEDRETLIAALAQRRPDVLVYVLVDPAIDLGVLTVVRRAAPQLPLILLGDPADLGVVAPYRN